MFFPAVAMKKRFKFRLSTLLCGVILVGYLIAIFTTWSTRSILIGSAISLIAALCSVILPKSSVPKLWRVTLWITFIAHLASAFCNRATAVIV